MANVITSILDAGSHYEMADYLKNRVRPTNILCLLVIFVLSVPFTIISLMYCPWMAIFPSAAGVVCMLVIVVNGMGGIYYTRVVLPLLLLILSSFYNAYFCTSMDDAITSVYLVELSFTLIPFIVFDFREKNFLIFCNLFSLFIMLIFPMFWQHFDMGYDSTILREGPLAVLTITLATIAQIGSITGLAILNRQSETRSSELIAEMNEKNAEIEVSRKELVENLEKLEVARTEENNRQWSAEGIAQLASILRNQAGGKDIYDQIVSMIVKYIRANQAGLYVAETESSEVRLTLNACYAYERKKYIEKSFDPGQGLLGQAYLEKEFIYLTEIPENYISISSGLGEARPTSLLIMPLQINDTIEGMLEIASFHKFAPYQLSFMEKIAENIAGFIQNNRINEHSKKMLEISQLQAEQMRAAEEEMRQNMEELEATQEEMRRNESLRIDEIARLEASFQNKAQEMQIKDSKMSSYITAINSTLATIEFDLSGRIISANDKFLEIMGYSLDEILGKHHRIFLPSNFMQEDQYNLFWQQLSKGKPQIGQVERKAKNEEVVLLHASYTPVVNSENRVEKIIKFAHEISRVKLSGLN